MEQRTGELIHRTCQLRRLSWLPVVPPPRQTGLTRAMTFQGRNVLLFGCLSRTAGQCDGAAHPPLKEL